MALGTSIPTKHGTMTLEQLAEIQPGMARLMHEFARRYWVLFYAAQAGNWELAAYMLNEGAKLLKTIAVTRPRYAGDLAAFERDNVGPLARAIEARDWSAFEKAFHAGIDASNAYHRKYNKGFIRFRLPNRFPDWLDVTSR